MRVLPAVIAKHPEAVEDVLAESELKLLLHGARRSAFWGNLVGPEGFEPSTNGL